MVDGRDFVDAVDIVPEIPANFKESISSKKWSERKEALEELLALFADSVRLDPKADYHEIVETLSKIIGKDANINVCAIAAKCVTQLALHLQTEFGPYVSIVTPVIFEKLKEKKVLLRDPLIEALDALYSTTTLEAMFEDIAAALLNLNPNIIIQTNQFLRRVFKTFNAQTAPRNVIRKLAPFIVKCTGEADPEAREASYSALGAIMKAIGKNAAMTMLTNVEMNKAKMAQIEMFYNQAVEEAGVEEVELDPWDFADAVDILPKLPPSFFYVGWQERKEAIEELLALLTDTVRLDPYPDYRRIVEALSKILAKGPNLNACAIAAKCVTMRDTNLFGDNWKGIEDKRGEKGIIGEKRG